MPGVNPWKPVYRPVTREAFDKAAKKAQVRRRDRQHVWEWVKHIEASGIIWASASHAVHAWVTGQLARRFADTTHVDSARPPLP